MSETDSSWQVKWMFLIERLKELIAKEGKQIVVYNVEARPNPERQYRKFMNVCEKAKQCVEAVVTTGLLGEERIFWPYHDVQFYIKDGEEKIRSTGNYEIIQQVFNL